MAELIGRWREGGLSARRFAQEAKIPVARLWYWKKRVGREAAAPAFVPLRIFASEPREPQSSFELVLPDGRRLLIPPDLTGRPLRQMLAALRAC